LRGDKMPRTSEELIREMHSNIEVLKTEVGYIRTTLNRCELGLSEVREINIKQNGGLARNKEELEQHLLNHKENDNKSMWRTGLVVGIITFIISMAVSFLKP
jgi:hypothetical protein